MITVKTPSRLHITLIDLNGSIGRMDGGIGLALEEPSVVIEVEKCPELRVRGQRVERARDAASRMLDSLKIKGGADINVREAYAEHAGLGSGTQLMLGVGLAISRLYGTESLPREIAHLMGRGGTSGIGTAAFEMGGFILDGGHPTREKKDFLPSSASDADPAPVLARYEFPDWSIGLVTPKGEVIHGQREVNIFQRNCPIPVDEVKRLCHIILMKTLPSVVEEDLTAFGESINDIQGIGFKRLEVGLQRSYVRELLHRCQKVCFGAGLSSFGPTIYCLVDDGDELVDAVGDDASVRFTKASNTGALIEH